MTQLVKLTVISEAGTRGICARRQTEMESELWHTKTDPDSSQDVESIEGQPRYEVEN